MPRRGLHPCAFGLAICCPPGVHLLVHCIHAKRTNLAAHPPGALPSSRPFTYPEGFTYSLLPESSAPAFEKPEGLLEVTVKEATNVPRMDLLGKVRWR